MASKKTAETVSQVWDRDLDAPAYLARLGPHPLNGVEVNNWGAPVKVAAAQYDWSVYNRPAAVDERYAIDRVVEMEKHAEVALQMAFADTVDAFSKFIVKSAAAREPLFDLTFNIAAHCEDKAAAAMLTDKLVRTLHADGQISKRAFKEYDENFKTASLDFLENGYPVLRGGESVVLKINTLVNLSNKCDRQLDIKRLRYQVEDVMVPRESHEFLQRDATANGQRIF